MTTYLNNRLDASKCIDTFDEMPLWSASFGLKLLDSVDYKLNISALDIGFGTGFPLTEIAMRLGKNSTVYGIDPWTEAIEKTKSKIAFYQISNVTLFEGVAEAIPLEDKSIDLITSNNGVNNTSDIDQVFRECSRIMRSGGQFIQTMNLDKSMFEFYDAFVHILESLKMYEEVDNIYQHIKSKRPSVDSIVNLLEKHDFIIKNIEYDQFNYRFVDATTMFNHYFIRLAFLDSWIDLLPKDKVVEIFSLTEDYLNKQSQLLGGFKLSIPYVLINAIRK